MKTQLRVMVCLLLAASTLSATWAQPVATVRLDSVWGCPGQIVEVPLRVYGINELGVDNFHFTIQINTDILEPILLSSPVQNEGFPEITYFDEEFSQRGNFVANFRGNNIMISWIDMMSASGQPSPRLADGSVLFKLNLRIREMPIEPVPLEIRIATMYRLIWPNSAPYRINTENGYVLAKSVPDVRIDRTLFDNPLYDHVGGDRIRIRDFSICVDHSFQFSASGAERFEWELFRTASGQLGSGQEGWVLDRTSVPDPIFTPRGSGYFSINHGIIISPTTYNFRVRGYNSYGCVGFDTVTVQVQHQIIRPLAERPNYIVVDREGATDTIWSINEERTHFVAKRGDVLNLFAELLPWTSGGVPVLAHSPYAFRWFPEDRVKNPRDSATQSLPINEPTWFWTEIRQLPLSMTEKGATSIHGCVQFLNIRVDILEDMFNGRIVAKNPENLEEYDYFCGIPGDTEHQAILAALIEGGLGERTFSWDFVSFDGGQAPKFSDPTANPTEITFFGTTEISVTISDSIGYTTLYHTLSVETPRTLSVSIEMDEASLRQYKLGFCPGMPLTLTATIENENAYAQIFWEEVRDNGAVYRRPDLQGRTVTIPRIRENTVYRAVVQSTERCVTLYNDGRSKEINPKAEPWTSIAIWMNNIENPTCNTDLIDLRFTVVNMGTNPFFEIFRNDKLIDTLTYTGTDPTGITHRVRSLNYWDRFNVRFTNISGQCVQSNSRFSINYETPNFTTTSDVKASVVSLLGGDTICDDPHGIFTFRLEDMEQFGENTTVIWMINDQEWGRYEFDPSLASSEGLPAGNFIINENLQISDSVAFTKGYAFHFNADGFPIVGEDFTNGDSLWAIVITRAMCGINPEGERIKRNIAGVVPRFITIDDAALAVTLDTTGLICRGDELTFTASVQNANMGRGLMSWFLNGKRVGEGATFTLEYALNDDTIVAIFESNFACARNLPLREMRIVTAHDLPKLVIVGDTIACTGESIQLYAKTDATLFSWTGDNLSSTTVQNPTATPSGVSTFRDFTVTVTDDKGCRSTETLTVRIAPRTEIIANIWLADPADTTICWNKLVLMESNFSPSVASSDFERVWLRNGAVTHNIGRELATSAIRDGDVWQLQIAMPSLNTCLPRTVLSNTIEFRVDNPVVQTRILASETTLCPGDSIQLSVIGGAHHRWTSSDPTFVERTEETFFVSPTQTTQFFVQAFGLRSLCFSKDTITIFVEDYKPVSISLQLDPAHHQNNCANPENAYSFMAQPTNSGALPRFDWYVNDVHVGYQKVNPAFGRQLQPGDVVHVVMTADVISCRSNIVTSNTVVILENPETPIIDGRKVICDDELTTLTILNPQSNVTYRWYSSDDNFDQILETGTTLIDVSIATYLVVAVAENGCESSETIIVEQGVQPRARIALATSLSEVRTRERIAFRNASTDWISAYWQFGDEQEEPNIGGIVEHEFDRIQNYPIVLRVISLDGCESFDTINLDVQPALAGVFIPSAFMPSSPDPRNQKLRVFAFEDIISIRFTVYGMDGRELFTTTNPNTGWDGRHGGREMPTGNYSWMVVVRLASGEEIVRSGVSTLVR